MRPSSFSGLDYSVYCCWSMVLIDGYRVKKSGHTLARVKIEIGNVFLETATYCIGYSFWPIRWKM